MELCPLTPPALPALADGGIAAGHPGEGKRWLASPGATKLWTWQPCTRECVALINLALSGKLYSVSDRPILMRFLWLITNPLVSRSAIAEYFPG